MSREALVLTGDAKENEAEFDALSAALYAQFAPQGALEQLLVEQIIAFTWRWRRVLRHENAAIRSGCRESVDDVRIDESLRDDRQFYGYARDSRPHD